ncbi:hypothetical protein Aperf_G00000031122 [Anoplocephala perfoliata]
MNPEIYEGEAVYRGFCSLRHQPLDQNDLPDYVALRVQAKPEAACTIHGSISGFVVTTAKSKSFPAYVINGYISLDDAIHTVAVRHSESLRDQLLAGYRFFSFSTTEDQDEFVQFLDTILDGNVSSFKRNTLLYNNNPTRGGNTGRPPGPYGSPSRPAQYMGPPVPPKRNWNQPRKQTYKYSHRTDKSDPYAVDKLRRIAHMRDLYDDEYM